MGNDGGSIPDRRDLVRTKAKAEQADKANQTRARWFFCALSKKPLQEPIVSCQLGKLYNKDAIIEYLLDKSSYGDGEEICGHIRSLKDVTTLKLTPNPAPVPQSDDPTSTSHAQFICSLTGKEMTGAQPFVYLRPCGCVFTQSGLKAVAGSNSPKEGEEKQLEVCPQCATKYDKSTDIFILNPSKEEEERMFTAMTVLRASEPAKKSKKRKNNAPDSEAPSKSQKTSSKAQPQLNPSISATSRAVASSLAEEEAKRKQGMSEAVKSLYTAKDGAKKETFMTMGTFTRYA